MSYGPHSNVYVKNIPAACEEQQVVDLFQPYGQIESLRIFRGQPPMPGKNAFAFVKYHQVHEAEAAINSLNGYNFNGCVLEVKFADADAGESKVELQAPPNDNLYVRGIPHFYSEEDVSSLFAPFGTVTSIRLLLKPEGGETISAMVRMSSIGEATQALQCLQSKKTPGGVQPLIVRYADPPELKARRQTKQANRFAPYPTSGGQRGSDPSMGSFGGSMYDQGGPTPPGASSSLYVKNLPTEADKLFLYEKFAPFGAIMSIKLLYDEAGRSKSIAFVNFADHIGATRALALNGAPAGDKILAVSFQFPKGGKPQGQQQHGGPYASTYSFPQSNVTSPTQTVFPTSGLSGGLSAGLSSQGYGMTTAPYNTAPVEQPGYYSMSLGAQPVVQTYSQQPLVPSGGMYQRY